MLVRYGQRPNELTVKKLAMLGCVTLVLAHSVKDIREKLQNNAYAGDLISHDSHIRSLQRVLPHRCAPLDLGKATEQLQTSKFGRAML
jgi:hypothetical protein